MLKITFYLKIIVFFSSVMIYKVGLGKIDEKLFISFHAFEKKDSPALYHGYEIIFPESGLVNKITCYYFPNRQLVQQDTVSFNKKTFFIKSYKQEDFFTKEKVRLIGGVKKEKVQMDYELRDTKYTNNFNFTNILLINKTLQPYLRTHWSSILSGNEDSFNFLIPSENDHYRFQFSKIEKAPSSYTNEQVALKFVAKSFFLKPFVPKIIFYYKNPRRSKLHVYEGPSLIYLTSDPEKKVLVLFQYPKNFPEFTKLKGFKEKCLKNWSPKSKKYDW